MVRTKVYSLIRQRASIRGMATVKDAPAFGFTVKEAAGIKVASRDDGSPTTSLSVVIKAGSRYEPAPGVSHLLEKFAYQVSVSKDIHLTLEHREENST